MTDDEMMRLVRALVAKWDGLPIASEAAPLGITVPREVLEAIIGTTVADVIVVMEGHLMIDAFEVPR